MKKQKIHTVYFPALVHRALTQAPSTPCISAQHANTQSAYGQASQPTFCYVKSTLKPELELTLRCPPDKWHECLCSLWLVFVAALLAAAYLFFKAGGYTTALELLPQESAVLKDFYLLLPWLLLIPIALLTDAVLASRHFRCHTRLELYSDLSMIYYLGRAHGMKKTMFGKISTESGIKIPYAVIQKIQVKKLYLRNIYRVRIFFKQSGGGIPGCRAVKSQIVKIYLAEADYLHLRQRLPVYALRFTL